MSDNEHDTTSDSLIKNWIDEKQRLEDMNLPTVASTACEDALLQLLAAARRSPTPEMSDVEANQVLEGVRSQAWPHDARGSVVAYIFTGRRIAIAAIVLLAFMLAGSVLRMTVPSRQSQENVPDVIVKEVLFESEHAGKVVRFEMTIYRTNQERKEAPNVPSL